MTRRVVVTGAGALTPVGASAEELWRGVLAGRSGVAEQPGWSRYAGLNTRLGAPVPDFPFDFPRKRVRTMGRLAKMALVATREALAQAQLEDAALTDPRVGVAFGSTHGSSTAMEGALAGLFRDGSFAEMPSSAYLKFMSHTVAANLALFFDIRGRVQSTCSACTSGSQGIGAGLESIRAGAADVMICGGAEELHEIPAAVFDVMFATSTGFDATPARTPRPYDRARDGLVVGEGAATLVLEEREHARARGATILAELCGYATNCDGVHATAPSVDGMEAVMRGALDNAGLGPADVQYINGHGTATELGDVAECEATARVFGAATPISSIKGHMGHTLGACGAIEAVVSIFALREQRLPQTHNLEDVDPRCAGVRHVPTSEAARVEHVLSQNFAFGGINTALVFRGA